MHSHLTYKQTILTTQWKDKPTDLEEWWHKGFPKQIERTKENILEEPSNIDSYIGKFKIVPKERVSVQGQDAVERGLES